MTNQEPETMSDHPIELREEVARIVDPKAWDAFDRVAEYQSRPQGEAPWSKFWHDLAWLAKNDTDAALAKADAILALPALSLSREGWGDLADYLHDQALLAESEAANRVGGQRNRLLAEAADCRRWSAALSASPLDGGEERSRGLPSDQAQATLLVPASVCEARSDPSDCQWPMCSCDPAADRVIDALLDLGWRPPPSPVQLAGQNDGHELSPGYKRNAAKRATSAGSMSGLLGPAKRTGAELGPRDENPTNTERGGAE